jgi:hypothetical protein
MILLSSIIGKRLPQAALCVFAALALTACGDEVTSGSTDAASPEGQLASNRTTIEGTPPVAVDAGSTYTFTPTAVDPDNAPIAFSIKNMPHWAHFDNSAGRLSGTPADTDVGDTDGVEISATSGHAIASLGPFNIKVRPRPVQSPVTPPNPNDAAPEISGTPPTTVTAGYVYTFTPAATDSDGDTLNFTIANEPAWATFNSATGLLTGTPPAASVGTFSKIVISVSDRQLVTSLAPFSIQVMPAPNHSPTISGEPAATATATESYTFTPTATDPDGNALTFSISNKPSWATFNTTSGRLAGTPSASNVGTFAGILISVTDGKSLVTLPTFSIKVAADSNHVPSISGTPARTVTAGTAYSFHPAATDPDSDRLTFSVQNRPTWATFNSTTGSLTGTPTSADVAKYDSIVISVTDGTATSSLTPFSIKVMGASNTAPTIAGQAVTSLNVGASYSFTPIASDANGNSLTFSIQNKPSWASFSTSSGALTGTPTAGDVGNYTNIVISVSDGTTSTSLTAFNVAVNQVSSGSAVLNWNPPTDNTDGTTITNLGGYRVYYGTSASNLSQVVQVANPGVTSYTVGNLSSGTWYFAVAAYTADGTVGVLSGIVSQTF